MVVLEPRTGTQITNSPPRAGELVFDTTSSTLKYSIDGVVVKTIADSELIGPIGINTSLPDRTLEVNATDGQALRLTYNDNNGTAANYVDFNVSSAGDLTVDASGNDILTGSTDSFDIQSHDGTTKGLKLGGVLLMATATQLNDIVSGTSSSDFSNLTITSDLTLSGHNGSSNGLILGSTLVTSTGSELNYLSGVTPGTVTASKVVVVDSNKDISSFRNLTASNLIGSVTSASSNIINNALTLNASYSGTATAGLGSSMTYKVQNGSGTLVNSCILSSSISTLTAGSEITKVDFKVLNGGSTLTALSITENANVNIRANNNTTLTLQRYTGTGDNLVAHTSSHANTIQFVGSNSAGNGTLTWGQIKNYCIASDQFGLEFYGSFSGSDCRFMRMEPNGTNSAIMYVDRINAGVRLDAPTLNLSTSLNVSKSIGSGSTQTLATFETSGPYSNAGVKIEFSGLNTASSAFVSYANINPVFNNAVSGTYASSMDFNVYYGNTMYAPLKLLNTGGVKINAPTANNTVLAIGTNANSTNQYGDIAFEGIGMTMARIRSVYIDGSTSKLEFYCRNSNSDSLVYTVAPGSSGGVVTGLGSLSSVTIDATGHNGTTLGLKLAGTLVTATAANINVLTAVTAGTASASKAIVLDSSKNIAGINSISSASLSLTSVNVSSNTEVIPAIITTQTSATPANGLATGISFKIENSANVDTTYGKVSIISSDITSGTESGQMSVKLMSGGTLTERLTLSNDGILGGMLYVQETSDRRVKENIVDADPTDSYEKIMQVGIKDYNFIGLKNTQRGFIAQELREIIPNAVELVKRGDIDDFHTVKTRDLVCYLIQTVQVMDKKIKSMEDLIKSNSYELI